jgi:hypothetical protein
MDIARKSEKEIRKLLRFYPAVAILGPRQVGKTTLAKSIIRADGIYIDLESSQDRARLSDARLYLSQFADKTVVLDEIQFMPDLMNELRSLIDENRRAGRFIILGSASPELLHSSSDSLAGRIGFVELPPFLQTEVSHDSAYEKLWLRGGFPPSYLAPDDSLSFTWRKDFVRSYVERDLRQIGLDADAILLERFWRMLAGFHGNIWNAENFARSLGISRNTVNRYLNFMESSFLMTRLQPFRTNTKKRLVKSQKIYVRDCGVLHYLNNISDWQGLQHHHLLGASWEGFVIQQIMGVASDRFQYYFYRTHQGAEADLVLERADKITLVEIKYSLSPTVSKSFAVVQEDIQPKQSFIIVPGGESYTNKNGALVVSLHDFLTKHLLQLQ